MGATDPGLFATLAQLWLREPDSAAVARAQSLGVAAAAAPAELAAEEPTELAAVKPIERAVQEPTERAAFEPAELAVAYADLLLLNVYPYGTVYTDAWGEINTDAVRDTAALFAAHGFAPPELRAVGAPDHLGLCLWFLGNFLAGPAANSTGSQAANLTGSLTAGAADRFLAETAFWAPVCCLAAERDPSAHEFYRGVARVTREALLAALSARTEAAEALGALGNSVLRESARPHPFGAGADADEEVRLRDLVRFLLAPARCGMFLSRARFGRIARGLGMRLPFGSRFEVAEWLFSSAGQNARLPGLLAALRTEAGAAEDEYTRWAQRWPLWRPAALYWLDRVRDMRSTLLAMEAMSESVDRAA